MHSNFPKPYTPSRYKRGSTREGTVAELGKFVAWNRRRHSSTRTSACMRMCRIALRGSQTGDCQPHPPKRRLKFGGLSHQEPQKHMNINY
eukprot:3669537-Amphidinium_carterae.1